MPSTIQNPQTKLTLMVTATKFSLFLELEQVHAKAILESRQKNLSETFNFEELKFSKLIQQKQALHMIRDSQTKLALILLCFIIFRACRNPCQSAFRV